MVIAPERETIMTKTYLASDGERSFLWELKDAQEAVEHMEARGGKATRVLIDTRKKVAFLETFVEDRGDAANDELRLKPEFRDHAGQLICEGQDLFPMAVVPIMGARRT